MALRTFLRTLGANAPKVETVLGGDRVRPGEELPYTVTLHGGGADVELERLAVELIIRLEDKEETESGWTNPHVLLENVLAGPRTLEAGEVRRLDGTFRLPWEMPFTHSRGLRVKGPRCAVRTRLEIDNAVDRGDFDEVEVHALPAQDAVLQAFAELGFRMEEAEVKAGMLGNQKTQTLPFWQENEHWFPPAYNWGSGAEAQLEVAVITPGPDTVEVVTGAVETHVFTPAQILAPGWTDWLDRHCRDHFAR
jgi:sporulation-control protein